MDFDREINSLVAKSLAKHYECVYLVDTEVERCTIFGVSFRPSGISLPGLSPMRMRAGTG